jgi:hypothetical protein
MSLAMFAAPFNDNQIESMANETDNIINKKRQTHNKTQKYHPKENFDSDKVNSVLEKIHKNSKTDDDEESSGLENFNPPPKPQSSGVNKTISTENMMNMNSQINQSNLMFKTLGRAPQPTYSTDNLELNDYSNYGDEKTNKEYYKQVMAGYKPIKNLVNKPYYNSQNYISETPNEEILLQKLNYMISLLEEQQDEKTSNVTEEVILYSFLGIFIIFIVDSFARVGKYVR